MGFTRAKWSGPESLQRTMYRHARASWPYAIVICLALGNAATPASPPRFDAVSVQEERHDFEHCVWVGPSNENDRRTAETSTESTAVSARSLGSNHRIVCRFHVVRRSDGSGGFDEAQIPSMMRDLNYGFRDTPFVFVRDPGVIYVDNDTYYNDFPTFSSAFDMLFDHFEPGIMSWYITPNINGAVAGTWIAPASAVRGILMAYFTAGSPANIVTPTHEMGHIFQVHHPFLPAFGTECTSGSNCASAGDLVCDTPASPIVCKGSKRGSKGGKGSKRSSNGSKCSKRGSKGSKGSKRGSKGSEGSK